MYRYLHPEGLPSDYTISMMIRLLPETPQEPFALWEILNDDHEPLVGLILDSEFTTTLLFPSYFFLSVCLFVAPVLHHISVWSHMVKAESSWIPISSQHTCRRETGAKCYENILTLVMCLLMLVAALPIWISYIFNQKPKQQSSFL